MRVTAEYTLSLERELYAQTRVILQSELIYPQITWCSDCVGIEPQKRTYVPNSSRCTASLVLTST